MLKLNHPNDRFFVFTLRPDLVVRVYVLLNGIDMPARRPPTDKRGPDLPNVNGPTRMRIREFMPAPFWVNRTRLGSRFPLRACCIDAADFALMLRTGGLHLPKEGSTPRFDARISPHPGGLLRGCVLAPPPTGLAPISRRDASGRATIATS
jgi:hypothetical protein